jgi:hypothetical protein
MTLIRVSTNNHIIIIYINIHIHIYTLYTCRHPCIRAYIHTYIHRWMVALSHASEYPDYHHVIADT